MSNYMTAANQTILWNTANRIPSFMQLSAPKKEIEFKRITEHFYRQQSHKPILSIQELQDINRQTITAFLPAKPPLHPNTNTNNKINPYSMANSLNTNSSNTNSLNTNSLNPNTNSLNQNTNSQMVETRQEKNDRAFQERQNMYAQMTEKPQMTLPDFFKEKDEDVKITNMDELIESYQKQRNLEIPVLPPPIPIPIPIPIQNKKKITFLEGEVSLDSQEMDSEKEKKNLGWKVNLEETRVIEDSYLQELEKRILQLENQVSRLLKKLDQEEKEKEDKSAEIQEILESMLLSIEQE